MEEIKVGYYVRTKEHGIFKVLKFVRTSYGYYWGINDKRKAFSIGKGGNLEVEITKHSPNIIDLIETGDYVNGRKMKILKRDIFQGKKRLVLDSGFGYEAWFYENQIEDIVTHEQLNSIKYVIGE